MKFVTNLNKVEQENAQGIADTVGLECCFRDDATDMFGNERPEDVAMYIPDQERRDEKIENWFKGYVFVQEMIRNALMDAGVSEEELEELYLYPGCEEEYFPGLEVDYEKAIDEY